MRIEPDVVPENLAKESANNFNDNHDFQLVHCLSAIRMCIIIAIYIFIYINVTF